MLEGINPVAVKLFDNSGFKARALSHSLTEEELIRELRGVKVLGIRSKTQITERVVEAAKSLEAVCAFCIGAKQIDQDACSKRGIAVFNDPYSNSRSVAEMVIGSIICIFRSLFQFNSQMHQGIWNKTVNGSREVRGKTLGIIGYGKIGTQVSVLAEGLGMKVLFNDIKERLPQGTARSCELSELLKRSDVVTLHIDDRRQNHNFFGEEQFSAMKKGAVFINLSRGFVVDILALSHSLENRLLRGAAVDVFPNEPPSNGAGFKIPLRGKPNVLLTPHIAGNTVEAQKQIARFVASQALEFLLTGNITESLNFPECSLKGVLGSRRVLHIHQNVAGVLGDINKIFARRKVNIDRQFLDTRGGLGYAITQCGRVPAALVEELKKLPHTIRVKGI